MALKNFRKQYKEVIKKSPYKVYKKYRDDTGAHPLKYSDVECAFASKHIHNVIPLPNYKMLDVGSYRKFILGLLVFYDIDTLDVRPLQGEHIEKETRIQMDIKNLKDEEKYHVITSLSSLEHFGLGRYGDEFDLNADKKAITNMVNALKTGGHLIFTTTIRRGLPELCFNAHRTYNLQLLHQFCVNLELVDEKFYSRELKRLCSEKEITSKPQTWDVYMGCWRKKE